VARKREVGAGYKLGGKSQSARAGRGGAADSGTRPRCSSRASGARLAGAPAGGGPVRCGGGVRPRP
jgi:hypothetical protein